MSAPEAWVGEHAAGPRFRVAARPGASKSAVLGLHDGALRIQVGAAPEKGKANKELVAFLAKTLAVARADLSLVSGQSARAKTFAVAGLDPVELRARLARVLEEA